MATKKEIELENKLTQMGKFIESLYFPELNTVDFMAVRKRFQELFPTVIINKTEGQ